LLELRMPRRDRGVRHRPVEHHKQPNGPWEVEAALPDQVGGPEVPDARWRYRALVQVPVLGAASLLRGEGAGHRQHLLGLTPEVRPRSQSPGQGLEAARGLQGKPVVEQDPGRCARCEQVPGLLASFPRGADDGLVHPRLQHRQRPGDAQRVTAVLDSKVERPLAPLQRYFAYELLALRGPGVRAACSPMPG
jgi:hypothetical protein